MKKLIIIFFAMAISGCNPEFEKADFLGTWEIVSTTDSETGEVDTLEEEYQFLVAVKLDSLYKDDDVYTWEIRGDSLFVDGWPFYIKEVTDNKVIVEQEYFYGHGRYLTEFKRRNNKYEKFDLMGIWEVVSETNLETGEVEFGEDQLDWLVAIVKHDSLYLFSHRIVDGLNLDSLYLTSYYKYEGLVWEIEGDSIFIDDWLFYHIKQLTEDELIIGNNHTAERYRRIK